MSAQGNVVIAIKAVDEASSVLDKIQGSMSVFGNALSGLGSGFSEVGSVIQGFAGAGVMGAAAASVGVVVKGLQDCFKEAKESEAVFNSLATSVEKQGVSWAKASEGVQTFLNGMMKVTSFSDEQMAKALKVLLDYGMDLDTAMKSLGTTMDLATGKQIDLETAAKAVGRAFEGNASLLTRMGVEVTKAKDDSVVFADAMTKLQEKFGGAAQSDLEAYAGKQKQVSVAIGELKEKIGTALLPLMTSLQDTFAKVVTGASQFVDDIGSVVREIGKIPAVQIAVKSLGEAWAGLQKGFSQVADELMKALLPVLKELWNAMKEIFVALEPVVEAFGEVWTALVGVAKEGEASYTIFNLIADVIKTLILPALQGLVELIKLVTPAIREMAEAFKAAVDAALSAIAGMKAAFADFQKWLVGGSIWPDMWRDMVSYTSKGFDDILSETSAGMSRFQGMFGGATVGLSATVGEPSRVGAAAGGPQTISVSIPITIQHMTGDTKDVQKLAREISRELGDVLKWRR